jgi:peptidyl-prolyl cis-trans isomerase C
MVPEFDKAVFGMKVAGAARNWKTPGFHITDHRDPTCRPFDEVKEQIKSTLLPSKQQEIFQKMKEDLKKNAKVSIKEDVLKNLDLTADDAGGVAPVQNKQ